MLNLAGLKTVKTNELKKGVRVRLRNGWNAEIADNAKGDIRMCKVYGYETEIGSVYSHDIFSAEIACSDFPGHMEVVLIEHTPKQLKLRDMVEAF